jgi:hypothetical protein
MAKVTIELDLRDSEDLREYNLYNNAGGMFDALFEISKNLKKKISYKYDSDCEDVLGLVFKEIAEILEENNVIIDKLS